MRFSVPGFKGFCFKVVGNLEDSLELANKDNHKATFEFNKVKIFRRYLRELNVEDSKFKNRAVGVQV